MTIEELKTRWSAIQALIKNAEQLHEEGKIEEAIVKLTEIMSIPPLDPRQCALVHYQRGFHYQTLGDMENALEDYTAVIDMSSPPLNHWANAHIQRGTVWLSQERLELAETDFNAVIEKNEVPIKSLAIALLNRGGVSLKKEMFDKAIEDFSVVINMPFQGTELMAGAYFNRAVALSEQNELEKELADYEKVILMPGAPVRLLLSSLFNRGNVLGIQGKWEEAIRSYTNLLEHASVKHNPMGFIEHFAGALINRGKAWEEIGEIGKELIDLSVIIEQTDVPNEQKSQAYHNRGVVNSTIGKRQESLDDFTNAINITDRSSEIRVRSFYNRARTYNKDGDADAALNDYAQAIAADGNAPEFKAGSLLNRGVIFEHQGELNKALIEYKKVLAIDNCPVQEKAKAHYNIAHVLRRTDSINTAIIEFEKARELESELDPDYNRIIEEIDNLDDGNKAAIRDGFIRVWLGPISNIRDFLSRGVESETLLCHYTNLRVANKLSLPSVSYFHFANAHSMNDPEEGKILLKCFGKEVRSAFERGREEGADIYVGSFLPTSKVENYDGDLVMWRTYGRDDNRNEAEGCSLIIDAEFFYDSPPGYVPGLKPNKAGLPLEGNARVTTKAGGNLGELSTRDLRRVLYFDNDGKFIGSLEDSTMLNQELHKLNVQLKSLLEMTSGSAKSVELVDKIIYVLISQIRYYAKSAYYSFEQELRVCRFAAPGDEKVEIENPIDYSLPGRSYIRSKEPFQPFLRKIVLGPKVRDVHKWQYLATVLNKRGLSVEVSQSEIPYR